MTRLLTLVALFLLLSSHELFLKSDTYFLDRESQAELYLFNGTFDQSENVITRDRIINPQITGPDYSFRPTADDYYDKGDVTYLKFKTGTTGTYVAGISTKPRVIELNGEDFTNYLEHEGLTEVISDRKTKGITNTSVQEKYAKHVKALLQVGGKITDDYSAVCNYPIEFVPLKNPYDLSIGDEMTFKLLFLGEPLGDQTVHVSSRKNEAVEEGDEMALRTNDRGEVSFTVSNEGHWYVATINMLESNEVNIDYESHWATLTFEVKAP